MITYLGSDSKNRYYKFDSVEEEKAFRAYWNKRPSPTSLFDCFKGIWK